VTEVKVKQSKQERK